MKHISITHFITLASAVVNVGIGYLGWSSIDWGQMTPEDITSSSVRYL